MTQKKYLTLFRLGVRQKVMLVLLTVLLCALTISGWMALTQEKHNTLKEINQRGSDISRFVAKSLSYSVVGYDYHAIQLLLDEITSSEDISYAKVTNAKGNSMAESGSPGDVDNANTVTFTQDIRLENDIVGILTLGLSTFSTIKRLESQKYALVKREALIILLIALGEFLALSYIIIRPVSVMSKSLNKSVDENGQIVGEVPVISKDEFGQLAELFNNLSGQLNAANAQLQSKVNVADKQLIQTNRQLVNQSNELKIISEQFRKMSVTDSLTGLYNRRRFEEILQSEIEMALRLSEGVSILVIDIDYFKKINDTYGHQCGDHVLKEVANTLKSCLRKTDILCRVGGEEFVAICKRADKSAAIIISEKLRREIEQLTVESEGNEISVTISVGIASANDYNDIEDAAMIYRYADIAVYFSKDNGRNRITHFDDIDTSDKNYVNVN